MFGIVRSALLAAVNLVAGAAWLKAVFMGLLFTLSVGAAAIITALVPDVEFVTTGLPQGALWLMTVLRFNVGIPLVLGALAARFLVRRLPVFG
jgi:hypothetical protein